MRPPPPAPARGPPSPPRHDVEILHDDGGIEQRAAIVKHQHRHLAERILLTDRVGIVLRGGGLDFHLAVETEHADGDPHLAAVRRPEARADGRHGNTPFLAARSAKLRSDDIAGDRRARRGAPKASQPVITRFTALGPLPFLSGSTSNEMRCPSASDLSPARSTAVTCTNTSRPPSSGLMKP